uniref:Uncharacterized protein n=1 Tax=Oryza sativa subsp. japonica TaxID=39947 RepID=Q6YVU1_ORYSJ|nr:hypothetical protein [Oryza sativa Japonica Group]
MGQPLRLSKSFAVTRLMCWDEAHVLGSRGVQGSVEEKPLSGREAEATGGGGAEVRCSGEAQVPICHRANRCWQLPPVEGAPQLDPTIAAPPQLDPIVTRPLLLDLAATVRSGCCKASDRGGIEALAIVEEEELRHAVTAVVVVAPEADDGGCAPPGTGDGRLATLPPSRESRYAIVIISLPTTVVVVVALSTGVRSDHHRAIPVAAVVTTVVIAPMDRRWGKGDGC